MEADMEYAEEDPYYRSSQFRVCLHLHLYAASLPIGQETQKHGPLSTLYDYLRTKQFSLNPTW
jgi:hypothetical protein